jgi:hypothetical protein
MTTKTNASPTAALGDGESDRKVRDALANGASAYVPDWETINHPRHYGGDTTYETIKVIEAWGLNFRLGNCVKYISRAGAKGNKRQDLEKALWYLQREIDQLGSGS